MSEETPTPKPTPAPAQRPAPQPAKTGPVHATPTDSLAAAEAAKWGRVDDAGNVWLRSSEGERIVGQYAASGSSEDALAIFVRRHLDLETQVAVVETRVENVHPDEVQKSIKTLTKELTEPAAVGDIESLRTRLEAVRERAAQRRTEIAAERQAAKEEALAYRTQIVERAEEIAGQDPQRIHWRNSREELSTLFDQWKQAQRHGARLDRAVEQGLWKRFSHARTLFDRERRRYFAELDSQRKEVVARKEKLIARAEELSTSTDWGATAAAYRDLMEEWKAAGRAARRQDDALWERFRAARQPFYDAREAFFNERNAEEVANRDAKLELVAEAEALLPIRDIEAARAKLRDIGERWDAIGPVPRADIDRTEGRLRRVEDAVRGAEVEQWRQTDPEKEQRSQGMAAQLEHLIAELDKEIAAAQAAGDEAKLKELGAAREARVAWLEQVQKDL
ncbi:ATPase [Actinobaculum suis]|uniref:DUF349 domain-containing protein n=2 Tax=Actinobaculum suis TaxID=1657 RepID=UPI00080879B1|nr:DUF349 domain-containing protein [Actinobaculum suis]OCA94504.1 ATPase [Actinobaculum suis]